MLYRILKFSCIFLLLSSSLLVHAQSTMLCEISTVSDKTVSVNETKYGNDIKYDFQIIDDENIISITIGVIRLEHHSILFQNSAQETSKKEVVESSHNEYEKMWVEELFHKVTLLHSENRIWEGNPSKISLWRAELKENRSMIGFWSVASDEELFVIFFNGFRVANDKSLVSEDLMIAAVDEIISKCNVVSI
ncbi:hypothetical protein ACPUEK_06175 [Marinomonas gallaica]|uniref:hypothetical protein n=1 Tax=Marinomonas gallaica TaxID=1806667 RepID=UPI003CE5C23D